MYAVIETGGKQYRVSPGQTLEVELLPAEPGAEVALDRVLLVSTGSQTLVGTPTVPGGRVVGTVVREGRGKKILVFKFKAKKRYRRLTGHRQDYLYLTVTDIQANGDSLVADEERQRYERIAQRAVQRYQATLLSEQSAEPATAEPATRTQARAQAQSEVAERPRTAARPQTAEQPQATATPRQPSKATAGATEPELEETETTEPELEETEETEE